MLEAALTNQPAGMNPFLPFSTYIPDGEPKVFGDRLYLYGSFDLFGGSYCSRCYHTVSAPLSDLTCWTDHGVSFTTDAVPWSDEVLFAPDALYHNGTYYLFFCLADGTEGVAQSDSPAGPFENARQITCNGAPITGIDPSVLEEDGRIYYTWDQTSLRVGELNEDMCSLKPDSIRNDILSNRPGREGFHEASSLRKLGKRYCMIYASEYTAAYPNCGGRPTKLDYAVSDAPFGPYERRGTVIDNTGCDPESWNNHGSIIKINDEWFVFYHASSNHSEASRRARVERLTVDEENGVIYEAHPTSNGFLKTLLPEHIVSPVNACRFLRGAYVTQTADGRFPAVGLRNGAGFVFSPVQFQADAYRLTVRYRAEMDTKLRVHLGTRNIVDTILPATERPHTIAFPFAAHGEQQPLLFEVFGPHGMDLCEIDTLQIAAAPALAH